MHLQTILWTIITVASLLFLTVEAAIRHIYKEEKDNGDNRN
jgi:hypothetical protein